MLSLKYTQCGPIILLNDCLVYAAYLLDNSVL